MLNLSLRAKVALVVALPTAGLLLYWLLKSDEEDDIDQHKITTSKQTIIEVKVPKDYVGSVIGRGGANIKDISEKTGARIDFAPRNEARPNDEEFRIAKIRGSQSAAQKAELMVHQIIADSEKHSVRITVRVRCLGRLIGRNGDTIRRIQRVSSAKVRIDAQGDESNPNNEKGITITGSMEQIENAKAMIEEKVKEDDMFHAKVSLVSANRETRKKHEGEGLKRDETGAGGDCSSGIVSSNLVINERWDESDETKPKKSFTEVYISAIIDPNDFWVQIINSQCIQFDELVGRMTSHYSTLAQGNNTDCVPSSVTVGDIVAATFEHDDSWYRARVTRVTDDTIHLFYVDYGDTGVVSLSQIRILDEVYLGLPFQAIHCHLADVKPISKTWTDEACNDFETLTHCAQWVVIMAQTVYYHCAKLDPIPCLHLIDTSGDTDTDINAEMVARGHAVVDTTRGNGSHDDTNTSGNKEENSAGGKLATTDGKTKVELSSENVANNDDVINSCESEKSGENISKISDVTQKCGVTQSDDVMANGVADDDEEL